MADRLGYTKRSCRLPSLLGAEHFSPDEVRVDGLLPWVGRADLQHERVAGGPRQRSQALDGAPRLQGKVGAVEFGQCLLDQRHPKLFPLSLKAEKENREDNEK